MHPFVWKTAGPGGHPHVRDHHLLAPERRFLLSCGGQSLLVDLPDPGEEGDEVGEVS